MRRPLHLLALLLLVASCVFVAACGDDEEPASSGGSQSSESTPEAKKIKVGPGLDPGTDMGPLVSEEQFNRVTGYIESGIKEGAKVLVGGKKAGSNGGYFVEPTVLTDTKPTMKVVREEIFGPVVCAEPFDDADLERIAKKANDTS